MTPYHKLVSDYARLLKKGRTYPLGTFKPAPRPEIPANAPKALFFAPHPDDECIVGAGALVTQGKEFAPRSLIVGSPAKVVREVTDDDLRPRLELRDRYARRSLAYLEAGLGVVTDER